LPLSLIGVSEGNWEVLVDGLKDGIDGEDVAMSLFGAGGRERLEDGKLVFVTIGALDVAKLGTIGFVTHGRH